MRKLQPFGLLLLLLLAVRVAGGGGGGWRRSGGDGGADAFSSIFSFGDSFADTGNTHFLAGQFAASQSPGWKPPYGMTFFQRPTGRYSDGRLVIDFLAADFGLPFLPPYLAHKASSGSGAVSNQGVNFAVVGATALDIEYYVDQKYPVAPPINASLTIQLGWFDAVRSSICNASQDCATQFRRSLFLVGEFGVNDYHTVFLNGKGPKEAISLVPRVVEAVSSAIKRLIQAGATTLAVAGVLPIGCEPFILTVFAKSGVGDRDPKTGCYANYNAVAELHNALLVANLEQMRGKNRNVRIAFLDFFRPIVEFVEQPATYGFMGTLRVCCGKGEPYNYNLSHNCGTPGTTVCRHPSEFVNWDGVHLTDAANSHLARTWLRAILQ